ncbi:hypothetical protein, partial [Xenorhabdus griffiniae]|uniref:hypothetical protein n=1 Tax=Xenorhabdus griffiniae TaxID=351672 RepID=UPI0023586053
MAFLIFWSPTTRVLGALRILHIPADRKRSHRQDHNLTSEIMQSYTCYQYALRIYSPQFWGHSIHN